MTSTSSDGEAASVRVPRHRARGQVQPRPIVSNPRTAIVALLLMSVSAQRRVNSKSSHAPEPTRLEVHLVPRQPGELATTEPCGRDEQPHGEEAFVVDM